MKRRKNVLALAGVCTVAAYASCALLLAGPTTPLTFSLGPVASVLEPQFSQNWSLFAPDPLSEERGVLARLRCGEVSTTKFIDITSPGTKKVQGTRLFPSRESRIVSGAILERFRRDQVTERLEGKSGVDDPVDKLRSDEERAHAAAERVLARYAALRIACPNDEGAPSAVQIRYVFHRLPGWSTRNDLSRTGEITEIRSKWIDL